MEKKCVKCLEIKNLNCFYLRKENKDGHHGVCKECYDKRIKKYISENKERRIETCKRYNEKNKDKYKLYYLLNKDKKKEYRLENKERINQNDRNRRNNDPLYKLSKSVRNLIRQSLKRKNFVKGSKTNQILGCTSIEFKEYLEDKFETWMSWDNYGLYNGEFNHGWDIDHITPLSSAKSEDEIIKLNHFTNLQPLCSKINRDIKKNKVE